MKLNNKGFAISTVMYMILIMAVILITLTLSILSGRKLILDSETKEAKNNIYNVYDISYRQALEILKNEAIVYAEENNIEKDSIRIGDLNSSIDKEILDGYKLTEKYLTIIPNGTSYDVYLGKTKTITDIGKTINNVIDIVDYKISGNSYQETYTGKNLFDISKVVSSSNVVNNGDGTLSITPSSTSSGVSAIRPRTLKDYAPNLEVGKTYILSAKTTGDNKYIYLGTSKSSWPFGKTRTITQEDLDSDVIWYATGADTTFTALISEIQIEEGTIVTSYEPYVGGEPSPNPEYPQDVQSVGEYDSTTGKYKIPVTLSGKNLYYENQSATSHLGVTITYDEETQVYTLNGTTNFIGNIILSSNMDIPLSEGEDVVITRHIAGGNITFPENTYILYGLFNQENTSYTTNRIQETSSSLKNQTVSVKTTVPKRGTSGLYRMYIQCLATSSEGQTTDSGITFDNFQIKFQIERGSVATEYEPYYQPTTTNIYLDEPLRKIDESIDIINFYTQKINRNIKEEIFNGDSSYYYSSTYFNNFLVAWKNQKDYISEPNVQAANLATHFYPYNVRVEYDLNLGRQQFGFPVSDNFSTVDDLKNLLTNEYNQGTPITVYYPLSTSVESTIDLPKLDTGIGNYKIEIGTNIKPSSVEFTVIQKIKQI